jgi:hypothetical protein
LLAVGGPAHHAAGVERAIGMKAATHHTGGEVGNW